MFQQTLIEKIKALLQDSLIGTKVEVVDIILRREGARLALKIFVDKEGGINLDECSRINRDLSNALEQANIIEDNYVVEVSSPGIDRNLKTDRDFIKMRGKKLKIVTTETVYGTNVFIGTMQDLAAGFVIIVTDSGNTYEIDRNLILRANQYLD